jgi:alkaline phosphatase
LAWLADDLARTRLPAIVFIHQLLDGDEGAVYVRNSAEVRAVLEAGRRVRAVFQGHHHEGGYRERGGIHYYTLKALVLGSGAENNAYAVVSTTADGTVTITGMRRAESRALPNLR